MNACAPTGAFEQGFEVDLAKEIAKRLELGSVKFVEMPFSGLVAGQQCPCDINFSQVTITEDRSKLVDFSGPYFDSNQGVLVKKGTKVSSLADAKGLKWGAQLSTRTRRPRRTGCGTRRRKRHYGRSKMAAMPCPPPMHTVTSARLPPVRSSSYRAFTVRMHPVTPIGSSDTPTSRSPAMPASSARLVTCTGRR